MHSRKSIRDAAISALSGSAEIAALVPTPKIEAGRVPPLDDAALPLILVYLRGETAEADRISESPRVYRLAADLVVEYVARMKMSTGPPEDALDEIAEAMEAALDNFEASRAGGFAIQVRYGSTDIAIDLDGARTTVSLVFRYSVEYGRAVFATSATDLTTAHLIHSVGDAAADRPADTVTLPNE